MPKDSIPSNLQKFQGPPRRDGWFSNLERNQSREDRIKKAISRRVKLPLVISNGAQVRDVSKIMLRSSVKKQKLGLLKTARPVDRGVGLYRTAGLLSARYKKSVFMDGLLEQRRYKWSPISLRLRSRKARSINVKQFSFLTAPNETMKVFSDIVDAEACCLSVELNFDDPKCTDIGPWLLLAVMRQKMAPVFTGGRMQNSLSKVISELDLDETLGMQVSPTFYGGKDVWAFPLQQRRKAGSSKGNEYHLPPQRAEKVGDKLCCAVNAWLDECVEQQLTRQGRILVKSIVGESLDNAERHSRPEYENDGDWMATGFMARRKDDDGKTQFRCHLAFLSIGVPISETVANCDPRLRQQMDNYCNIHKSGSVGEKHADDHLRTVFALQDTVTRDRSATAERRGGTGFGDLIHFFSDLAGNDSDVSSATLAVVSGHTCLHIGLPYAEGIGQQIPGSPRNIWLNAANSSKEPPDAKAVCELENEFRGTLITMGFTLDPDYLRRTVNGTD